MMSFRTTFMKASLVWNFEIKGRPTSSAFPGLTNSHVRYPKENTFSFV